jgi:hypothetical protein
MEQRCGQEEGVEYGALRDRIHVRTGARAEPCTEILSRFVTSVDSDRWAAHHIQSVARPFKIQPVRSLCCTDDLSEGMYARIGTPCGYGDDLSVEEFGKRIF